MAKENKLYTLRSVSVMTNLSVKSLYSVIKDKKIPKSWYKCTPKGYHLSDKFMEHYYEQAQRLSAARLIYMNLLEVIGDEELTLRSVIKPYLGEHPCQGPTKSRGVRCLRPAIKDILTLDMRWLTTIKDTKTPIVIEALLAINERVHNYTGVVSDYSHIKDKS